MTYVRSFQGYRPPKRFDGVAFTQALIQESALEDGTYSTIETKTLVADADPSKPALRNFTTSLATLQEGWYLIVWKDAAGAAFASDPVSFHVVSPIAWRPSVTDVGAILRARTRDGDQSSSTFGEELGTFTDATRPTDDETERLIDNAVDEVAARLGRTTITDAQDQGLAKQLAALRAAMGVEVSYFPEQTNADSSVFDHLQTLYESGMRALIEALGDTSATGKGIYSIPMRSELADYFA